MPDTNGEESFSVDELVAQIRGRLTSGQHQSPPAIRASMVTDAVVGDRRDEFHRVFNQAILKLEREGVAFGSSVSAESRPLGSDGARGSAARPAKNSKDWARNPISRDSVLAAVMEFDRNGREETLSRHGFRRALDYVVEHEGNEYDSKALYGIAYSIQYPDERPIRERGFSGGATVARKLEALGFKIKRLRGLADAALARPGTRVWIVRAGREGENEDIAREQGVVVVGWSRLGPLGTDTTLNQLKELIRRAAGERHEASVGEHARTLYRFIHELREGDLVVLPLRSAPGKVSIGIIDGPFSYRPYGVFADRDAHYQRSVTWLSWGLPYERFDSDLRDAFGASDSLSEIQREQSVARLLGAARQASGIAAPEPASRPSGNAAATLSAPANAQSPPPSAKRASYKEPSLEEILAAIESSGLRIDERTLRRYHVSLKTRGLVILAGVSGGGKTWLAESYAAAVKAESLVIPVAPHWTTNEDLLGFLNPLTDDYCHTPFSRFLFEAGEEYLAAQDAGQTARPFHAILDEMNLARVEHYFATFLSAMETRARYGSSEVSLASNLVARLTPNLRVIGTVNIDETTFGFADKVYDRAQLIELHALPGMLSEHMKDKPYKDMVLAIWEALRLVAPFAYRVLDEIGVYVDEAASLGTSWQEAVDDQLLQKVLPKIGGIDPRNAAALQQITDITDGNFPLTHEKARGMLEDFTLHGVVSYF